MTRRRRPVPQKLTPHVAFAYLHSGRNSASFGYCKTRLFMFEGYRTGSPPYLLSQRVGSGRIVEARNETAAQFLDTDCEWLLWCDDDMGFGHDALARLLASADPKAAPIVGGLCFGFRVGTPGHDDELQAEYLEMFPTIYQFEERDDEVGFIAAVHYPPDTLVNCSATGSAFILIHRKVLERMRACYGDAWYDPITHPKGKTGPTTFSEDLSFCVRAAALDLPVHVHTGVATSHDKGGIFGTELNYQRQLAGLLLVDSDGTWKVSPDDVKGLIAGHELVA